MAKYVRDKRSPIPSNQHVSKVMSANKAKDTKPEIELRKLLWNNGIRGYRINKKGIPGTPDITISKKRLAIFLNGCFWHRCPHCDLPLPKSNKELISLININNFKVLKNNSNKNFFCVKKFN